MGRAREFKDEQVIDRAMRLFWERGYEHSSLKELLAVMNIQNGSFYNTYGSKKNLFIKSLENYYQDLARSREKLFQSPASFKEKIRTVFQYALDRQKRRDCPRGCFIVNSLSADVLESEEIRKFLLSYLDDFEAFIEKQIRIAIENGELDSGIDSIKTAAVVNIYMQGMLKLCVVDFSESKLREQTEYFLSALGF